MRIVPLSEAKAHLSELAEEVHKTHERLVITKNGREHVVVMATADLESIEATLELLSDPEAMEAVREGRADFARGDYFTEEQVRAMLAERSGRP